MFGSVKQCARCFDLLCPRPVRKPGGWTTWGVGVRRTPRTSLVMDSVADLLLKWSPFRHPCGSGSRGGFCWSTHLCGDSTFGKNVQVIHSLIHSFTWVENTHYRPVKSRFGSGSRGHSRKQNKARPHGGTCLRKNMNSSRRDCMTCQA